MTYEVSGRGTWEHNPWVVVYEFETFKIRNLEILNR